MCLCLSVCFILTFLIVEIHIPTQTQNAVFLTALRHFSSHPHLTDATESLSIHTSPSPPRAQSPHQQGSRHLSDGCGSVQRKGWGGSPLHWSVDGCTFCWWHWLSGPPSHCALVHGGVHTLLLVASRGRRWRRGLVEDVEILTERVLIPVGPSQDRSASDPSARIPTGWSVTLVITLAPL